MHLKSNILKVRIARPMIFRISKFLRECVRKVTGVSGVCQESYWFEEYIETIAI